MGFHAMSKNKVMETQENLTIFLVKVKSSYCMSLKHVSFPMMNTYPVCVIGTHPQHSVADTTTHVERKSFMLMQRHLVCITKMYPNPKLTSENIFEVLVACSSVAGVSEVMCLKRDMHKMRFFNFLTASVIMGFSSR